MRCTDIHISSVRNHLATDIRGFSPGFNVFTGPNGAGKTTVIEALSVAALTKSFTGAADAVLVSTGSTSYHIDARFISDNKVPLQCKVDFNSGPPAKRTILVNSDKLRRSSDLIGRIPIVALTPDDKVITNGSPEERRRFLSLVLSQASSLYLEDEMELRKALKHRNSLLHDCRQRGVSVGSARQLLAPWTEMVIERSARLMSRRSNFIQEFRPYLEKSYNEVSAGNETPSLKYCPLGFEDIDDGIDFRLLLEKEFERREGEELRRATTLAGAHRDELLLYIDSGREARRFASQGQHKTLLVAMKLAEFQYLLDVTGETPILLLDDVFSELDVDRATRLLELIAGGLYGQTFITSTTRETLSDFLLQRNLEHKLFTVANGAITEIL